jgi:hypothetical protein
MMFERLEFERLFYDFDVSERNSRFVMNFELKDDVFLDFIDGSFATKNSEIPIPM